MKTILICLALVSAVLGDEYTDRYDSVNVDEVLANENLFEAYFKCVMDKSRCTAEGKELKAHLKEGIETECAKCTETQKKKAHTVIVHLIRKKPNHWAEMCQKYDPNRTKCPIYEQKYKN